MENTIQSFLAFNVAKKAAELFEALLNLPEDKRNWSSGGNARTALDMVAECALNNKYSADLIETQQWTMNDPEGYAKEKAKLAAGDLDALKALLDENTAHLIEVINAMTDDKLSIIVKIPYGDFPLSETMAYPYWNMSYHLGQINYIDMMLGN